MVEEPLAVLAGDVEEGAPKPERRQPIKQTEIGIAIRVQHADEADLPRHPNKRGVKPVERVGFRRQAQRIGAGARQRLRLRRERFADVGRTCERGADRARLSGRLDRGGDRLDQDGADWTDGRIGDVENVGAAVERNTSFHGVDDAGEHLGHGSKHKMDRRARQGPTSRPTAHGRTHNLLQKKRIAQDNIVRSPLAIRLLVMLPASRRGTSDRLICDKQRLSAVTRLPQFCHDLALRGDRADDGADFLPTPPSPRS